MRSSLAVAAKGQCVVSLPVGVAGASTNLCTKMTFTETSVLSPDGSETSQFAVFMDGFAEPVYSGVSADGLVLWVY